MATLTFEVTLSRVDCSCGGVYAITEKARAEAQRNGEIWHCPYCRTGWGYHRSEADKVRDELRIANNALASERARLDQAREEARHANRRASAQRGVTTKLKSRVAAGVCPCCNRTFDNLARHMAGQHPAWNAEAK